jgi:hypothetical protein
MNMKKSPASQLRMFAEAPFVRGSDTSEAAARAIEPDMNALQQKVLAHLRGCSALGATDDEMQRALAMNPSTQRPRRIELVNKGLVVDSGMKRRTGSGRWAVVWIATPRP